MGRAVGDHRGEQTGEDGAIEEGVMQVVDDYAQGAREEARIRNSGAEGLGVDLGANLEEQMLEVVDCMSWEAPRIGNGNSAAEHCLLVPAGERRCDSIVAVAGAWAAASAATMRLAFSRSSELPMMCLHRLVGGSDKNRFCDKRFVPARAQHACEAIVSKYYSVGFLRVNLRWQRIWIVGLVVCHYPGDIGCSRSIQDGLAPWQRVRKVRTHTYCRE